VQVNSYKRFVAGSWAPTATAWGVDNRTTGFRVVGQGTKGLRIECRLPGADANPYVAFAAALASGLDGIRNKIEPPPEHFGDGYESGAGGAGGEDSGGGGGAGVAALPASLGEAAARFGGSAFVERAFGADVRAHYAHFYASEARAYAAAVTDWERRRYFEQI